MVDIYLHNRTGFQPPTSAADYEFFMLPSFSLAMCLALPSACGCFLRLFSSHLFYPIHVDRLISQECKCVRTDSGKSVGIFPPHTVFPLCCLPPLPLFPHSTVSPNQLPPSLPSSYLCCLFCQVILKSFTGSTGVTLPALRCLFWRTKEGLSGKCPWLKGKSWGFVWIRQWCRRWYGWYLIIFPSIYDACQISK